MSAPGTPNSRAPSDYAASATASLLRARPYRFATQVATVENPDPAHKDQHGSSSVPIYQSATFKGMGGGYDYTRSGNPTRTHLQHHLAKISSARHAFCVSSGMGALDVILRLLKPGDEIIAGNDLYGGSNRLLKYIQTHSGITTHHVDTTNPSSVLPYLTPEHKVAMVLLESPTNPLLQIADIEKIAQLVHDSHPEALVVVDNTMLSPYLQRPLEHGADIVYDSATKYLSGHHDLMAGVICCNKDSVAEGIYFTINSVGNGLAPFDSFLLLRGIKTLALRMDRQQITTMRIATYLHDLGFKVNYPGLASHPGKEVHDRISSGYGGVLSFETGDKLLSERVVGATRLWGISVSFGCVNSLISMPCLMSHASIDPATRAARNLPEDLIRLCIGIEDADDLLDDLEAALLEAGLIRVVDEAGDRALVERAVPWTETSVSSEESFVVSAPGKVILFGEHAVVHGVPAIATSLDKRCYGLTSWRTDDSIQLDLPDLKFSQTWSPSSLPWDLLTKTENQSTPPETPNTQLLASLAENLLKGINDIGVLHAAQAFLYLFMHLHNEDQSGQKLTIRSTIPISAGLGSSAAFSVCVAASLLKGQGLLKLKNSSVLKSDAELVNSWAFFAEKILHGTPSGVDNTVSTFGGALSYTKAVNSKPGNVEHMQTFRPIRLLITNSNVSRNTKTLVAEVARRKLEEPDVINSLFDKITVISTSAKESLLDGQVKRSVLVSALEKLVDQNHAHLVSLGVGHPALEHIRTKALEYNLHTKLTGAGGGGCAITIIPDDFSAENLVGLTQALGEKGFTAFETLIGGPGLGVVQSNAYKEFVSTSTQNLSKWADGVGAWSFS